MALISSLSKDKCFALCSQGQVETGFSLHRFAALNYSESGPFLAVHRINLNSNDPVNKYCFPHIFREYRGYGGSIHREIP